MGKVNRDKIGRLDDNFLNDIYEVQKDRIINGKDKKIVGTKRLSLAIHRHPLFKKIKEDMKKADLPSKKGNVAGIAGILAGVVTFIIVALIIVLILAIWVGNFSIITNQLTSIPAQNNITNISQYAQVTFGNLNIAFSQFKWWSILIIFGMMVGVLLSNFLIKIHPSFFIIYIIIAVILVFFSIVISNSFETLYTSGDALSISLQGFSGGSWIILYLPVWVTVISIIGGVLLFVSLGRDDTQGDLI